MKERGRCLQEITGSCSGCNIIEIAILAMRWRGKELDQAQQHVAKYYCPSGCEPDSLHDHINKNASHALGQRKHENIDFGRGRKPLRQKPKKGLPGSKMSKSTTGRFFVPV